MSTQNENTQSRPSLEAYLRRTRFTNDELSPIQERHLKYALTTNIRGKQIIDILKKHGVEFTNASVLDVGCGYGGFAIEAKREGAATVYGIDIDPKTIEMANANLSNESSSTGISFVACDITDECIFQLLPSEAFNIITLCDVMEHIADSVKVVEAISILTAIGGKVYFAIPNGYHALDVIENESHVSLFGISLLDPLLWQLKNRKSGQISYKRWELYLSLFASFGFENIELFDTSPGVPCDEMHTFLLHKYNALLKSADKKLKGEEPHYVNAVMHKMTKLKYELMADLDNKTPEQLKWKYLTPIWKGLATKARKSILDQSSVRISDDVKINVSFQSINKYNVSCAIKIENENELTVTVNHDKNTYKDAVLDFSCWFFRNGERYRNIWYTTNPIFKLQLSEYGDYSARIAVKQVGEHFSAHYPIDTITVPFLHGASS